MEKAVNYDVGMRASADRPSRPVFDPVTVRREMEIIRRDLGCSAVRIFGEDPDRLRVAAAYALEAGLHVWLSPDLFNSGRREWLPYLAACARTARELGSPDVVFVVGRELTFFMRGLVLGGDAFARMRTFSSVPRLLANLAVRGSWHRRLNRFLAEATATVRAEFAGPVTYASGPWEEVDWSIFDLVSVDLYRDASNEAAFPERTRAYLGHGKPVAITEFGCCTHRGAAARGAMGWTVVDRRATPPAVRPGLVRDEHEQAAYLRDLLDIFAEAGVETAFAFTFASYSYPRDPDPRHDLDLAAYGLVACYRDQKGTTYPDMPWEPKEAFHAYASWPRES
ncbi:hypothetical protein [Streptosporangium sp. NPDC051022]|uniref:hypothetical protein n=1 Tax=Streptosporangium sp. NPDC051022 TaxID=3155752 RepID=UPI0034220D4D